MSKYKLLFQKLLEKSAKNFIIFGLKREEDQKLDEGQTLELVETLEAPRDQVLRVTRLISKSPNVSSRPPPLFVQFKTSSLRDNVLKATRNLKGLDKYNGVKIAADLTPNERQRLLTDYKWLELKKKEGNCNSYL